MEVNVVEDCAEMRKPDSTVGYVILIAVCAVLLCFFSGLTYKFYNDSEDINLLKGEQGLKQFKNYIPILEKNRFLPLQFSTISFKPGSKTGNLDKSSKFQAFILSTLISTTLIFKSGQFDAITAIVGPPT